MKQKRYYKVLTEDLKAPSNTNFSYENWENRTFRVEGKLFMCANGLHLYKSLKNVSVGDFGSRVFEAIPIGNEYIEDEDKICCREIKILREIDASKVKDSAWAYWYCLYIKDRRDVRKNIRDSKWAYEYCKYIKDRKEVWKNITDSEYACRYCLDVKDRKEVWKNIKDNKWAYWYCRNVKNRKEVRKYIKEK